MIATIIGAVVNSALGKIADAFTRYQDRKISEAEFKAEVDKAKAEAESEIETAWAKASAEIYASAQQTVQASFTAPGWFTRNAWSACVWSLLVVLLWYALAVPILAGWGIMFGAVGDRLLEWCVGILGGLLGIGTILDRFGKR